MGNQEAKQASVRAVTGTSLDYNSDWSALFDLAGIAAFGWNGRLLAWLNLKMGTGFTDLSSAMAAFAIANGAKDWDSLGSFSASIYDPAATALFARMTVQPDNTRKGLINTLITSLKSNGIWANLDALYVMAAHDAQAARLNWVQDLYNLTAVNSPTFTVDRGYAGDGSSSYLNTGLNPGAGGLKFVTNSGHLSVYDRATRAGNGTFQAGVISGAGGSAVTAIQTRSASDLNIDGVNDAFSEAGVANASNPAFYAADRIASTSFRHYRNGVYTGPATITATAPDGSNSVCLLAIGNAGGPIGFSADQEAAATIGSGLGTTMQPQLYTAMQAYMTGVGANV